MFRLRIACVFFCLLFTVQGFSREPLRPAGLRCLYLDKPLGIDNPHPFFSWTLQSDRNNQQQSAFEIIVGDLPADIRKGRGGVWSTGKITTSDHLQIQYGGPALQSFHRYYWSVRVYNQEGIPSSWAEPTWFETGMLQPADWSARWISDGSVLPAHDEEYYQPDPMPLFRKDFDIGQVATARLYISGLGYYEAYLNGQKVGDQVLDPGFTTYRKEALYSVYDVTALLRKGKNCLGIMLGNGWWNPLPMKFFGRWELRDYQQTGRPCLLAEIRVQLKNGDWRIIASDDSWLTREGPIVRNNVYLGEYDDGRLDPAGWNLPGTDLSGWKKASVAQGPAGRLTRQMQPPVRITRVIAPKRIWPLGKDTFLVDMGQNFAGVARILVQGPAGTEIHLRYGEDTFSNGRLNVMTTVATQIKKGGISGGPGAPETAWQEDRYILSGRGREEWHPRFTFHGFRYVEITGWPGTPTLQDIEGLRMNADLRPVGSFACSDSLLNRLHEAVQWTFLSNVFSVQSDCPGREKMGYGGDMVATADAFLYNFDMANFYRKTIQDFANEQRPMGGITEIAPFTGIADRGYGDESGPLGWELAFAYLQEQLYTFYGDKEIIARHYDAFIRQVEFLQSRSRDNLFDWDISDHEALDPKPEALSASAFYYHHAKLAAEFAGILGKRDDSLQYAALASRIRSAIIAKFLVPGTGRFDNGTQSAQVFALWYGLSPEPEKSFDWLMEECKRHDWHLSTGIFGTRMLLDVLRQWGRNEVAYKMVQQRDFPGWGYMLANGATTLWETWARPGTVYSENHPMFGSVDEWFYRAVLGINPASPGFRQILIQPQPGGNLTWAAGTYESIQGSIRSEWKISEGRFMLTVDIPAGCSASICLPTDRVGEVQESGKRVQASADGKGHAVVETGSGHFEFSVPYQ